MSQQGNDEPLPVPVCFEMPVSEIIQFLHETFPSGWQIYAGATFKRRLERMLSKAFLSFQEKSIVEHCMSPYPTCA